MMIWDEFERMKKDLETNYFSQIYRIDDVNFELKKLEEKHERGVGEHSKLKKKLGIIIKKDVDKE